MFYSDDMTIRKGSKTAKPQKSKNPTETEKLHNPVINPPNVHITNSHESINPETLINPIDSQPIIQENSQNHQNIQNNQNLQTLQNHQKPHANLKNHANLQNHASLQNHSNLQNDQNNLSNQNLLRSRHNSDDESDANVIADGYERIVNQVRPPGSTIAAINRKNPQWDELDIIFEEQVWNDLGLVIKLVGEDGACLFRSVSDQIYGDEEYHGMVRQQTCDYIANNGDYREG